MTKVIDLKQHRRHVAMNKHPISWIYGVTTVSQRRHDLLPKTLESLKNAGFPEPILFVDGGNHEDYADLGLECVVRKSPVGSYANWAMAMTDLWFRSPTAQRYALFEDDILLCKNVRQYIDQVQMKEDTFLNLFEHPVLHDEQRNNGFFHPENEQRCLGALSLVFGNVTMRRLLGDPEFFDRAIHKRNGQDGVVARCTKRLKIREMVHHPSLVQHAGKESIIGSNRWPYEETLSLSFVSSQFDALSLKGGTK